MSLIHNGDEKLDYSVVNELIFKIFPKHFPELSFRSHTFPCLECPTRGFEVELSYNTLFNKTEYECKSKDFIHFTKIESMYKILESKSFHMKNIREQKKDPTELVFWYKEIEKFNDRILKSERNNIFQFSMMESNNDNINNSYMWEKYGDNGYGCILGFELINPIRTPFLNGKIIYGDSIIPRIEDMINDTYTYLNEHNLVLENGYELFSSIFSFHKLDEFRIENETRIIFDEKDYVLNKNYDFTDIEGEMDFLIHSRKKLNISSIKPQPNLKNHFFKIKFIRLGSQLGENEKKNVRNQISTLTSDYKYDISIE